MHSDSLTDRYDTAELQADEPLARAAAHPARGTESIRSLVWVASLRTLSRRCATVTPRVVGASPT